MISAGLRAFEGASRQLAIIGDSTIGSPSTGIC
jgi:hypothetical protein